jgi:hypothetical protein
MNAVETTMDRVEQNREPVAELSPEEQAVLARMQEQAREDRPNRLGRFLKSPPLFFIPCF